MCTVLASSRIRTLVWIAALLFAALPSSSQPTPLREQLKSAEIPNDSFSETELDELVDGMSGINAPYAFLAYLRIQDDEPSGKQYGKQYFVRYNQTSGAILRSQLNLGPEDDCCLSPESIQFVDDYVLVSFHLNPDASTVVVVDRNLNLAEKVYGFGINRVGKNKIVMIEDMVHWASVHAERVETIDLDTGATKELYPPKGDDLRRRFALEYSKHIPSKRICKQLRDAPCNPELYDEHVTFLNPVGEGRFALVVKREAYQATKKDEEPALVESEYALYLYQRGKTGWLYCQKKMSESGVDSWDPEDENAYDIAKSRCIPNKPVVSDRSTAGYSPFPQPKRRAK